MYRAEARTIAILGLAACLGCSGLLAQQPSDAVLQRTFQEGHEALAQKRFPDAEKAFGKLVQLDPTAAVPYANLGLVYFEERKFSQAVPAFQKSLALDPHLSNSRYFLAMSLSELGRYSEALPGLEKGFTSTRNPELKRLLGLHLERNYTGLGRNADAVAVALELTRLYPNDPEVLYQTGRLCGNFAYLAMQKLQQAAPESAWRHLASGELFESQGHVDLAIREYRRVLALSPSMPGIHYRLGRVLLVSKQPEAQAGALKEFDEELEIDPSNASAAYEAGEIYRKQGKLSKARSLFSSALKYYPNLEEAQVGLSKVLIAENEPAAAVAHLQTALTLNPEDDVAYFQLAQAYRQLGNTQEQQKALVQFQHLESRKAQHQEKLSVDAYQVQGVTEQKLDSKHP